jgi:16S rRNA (cytosine967-C5)-methyltransferase
MNRSAARIVRAAAPTPTPTEDIERFASGALLDALASASSSARMDWSKSRTVLARAGRQARSLNSRRRRLHGDILHALVRHDRTLELLIERAGLPSGANPRTRAKAQVHAALVALFGLDPALVEGPCDASEWADPAHLLTGWVLETDPSDADALGAAASLPTWIAKQLIDGFGEDAVALAASLNQRAPLAVRVLRGDRDATAVELEGSPSELSPHAIILPTHGDVRRTAAFQEGRVVSQDVGSQLIADLVNARPGELVIDACAGAGGKTLALAAAMEGTGRLFACDVRFDALEEARSRLRAASLGESVQTVTLPESGGLPKRLRKVVGQADAVLVDAPCTGSGSLRRRPQARWIASAQNFFALPAEQGAILDRVAPLVRPGGRLIYATCSLFRPENEGVVEAFLAAHPDFVLEPAAFDPPRDETLLSGGCLRTRPDLHGTDGFFAAVLRREAS